MDTDEIKFEAVYGGVGKYNNFVLVPPMKGQPASKINRRFLCDCAIDFGSTTPIIISPCTDVNHQEHDFLVPFYKTNDQMLLYYDRIMGGVDEDWKASIQNDCQLLQSVKNGSQNHHNTKFHCMGKPFEDGLEGDYTEDEWAERLYYCVKGNTPFGVEVVPAYQYTRNFNKFQQIVSDIKKDEFFFFRGVPDLLFSRNSHAIPSSFYIGNELLEVKTKPNTNKTDTETEFAQVASSMYTIAVAKMLRQLRNGTTPEKVTSYCL